MRYGVMIILALLFCSCDSTTEPTVEVSVFEGTIQESNFPSREVSTYYILIPGATKNHAIISYEFMLDDGSYKNAEWNTTIHLDKDNDIFAYGENGYYLVCTGSVTYFSSRQFRLKYIK